MYVDWIHSPWHGPLFSPDKYCSGLPWWLSGKESTCPCLRPGFHSWVGKIPWRRAWQPTPVFFPGESHGPRSLAGYNPWGCKELDMAEWLSTNTHEVLQIVWLNEILHVAALEQKLPVMLNSKGEVRTTKISIKPCISTSQQLRRQGTVTILYIWGRANLRPVKSAPHHSQRLGSKIMEERNFLVPSKGPRQETWWRPSNCPKKGKEINFILSHHN